MTPGRLACAALTALAAGCAAAPTAPAPEPAPPPPPAHLEPPNTAAAPQAGAAVPKALPTAARAAPMAEAPTQDFVPLPQIQAAFDLQKRYFWTLYAAHLQSRPGLRGRVLVSFTIRPDGSASDVRLVDSDLGDGDLEQDVLKEVAAMVFPTARGATPVQDYPIIFSSPKVPRK